MAGESLTWRDLQRAAPDLARLGAARLDAMGVAFLGTLRADGTPRISPIEPYVVVGDLLLGAMSWSGKVDDLRRDPRCVLHSAVTGVDTGEGELKLYGHAVEVGQDVRDVVRHGWWTGLPAAKAVVFSLQIEQAAFVEWDLEDAVMTVHRWSPVAGYRRHSRSYP